MGPRETKLDPAWDWASRRECAKANKCRHRRWRDERASHAQEYMISEAWVKELEQ